MTRNQLVCLLVILFSLGNYQVHAFSNPTSSLRGDKLPFTDSPTAATAMDEDTLLIHMINLAPSPYSNRHDCMRAGFGIFLSLEKIIREYGFPLKVAYYDGSTDFDDPDWIQAVLSGADGILLGAETWCQGPAYYSRRFFEQAGAINLGGVHASAWASSGGYHTGGEMTISTNLRSLMGMGANVYTMGQKLMDFTTDERLKPEAGNFSLFDVWYMDQFARYTAAVLMAGNDNDTFVSLCDQLACSPFYYSGSFPPDKKTLKAFQPLKRRLNQAADANSNAYKALYSLFSSVAE